MPSLPLPFSLYFIILFLYLKILLKRVVMVPASG